MFRRVSVPCVRCSRLCSAGWLRLSCPACVGLDYVPQDGFGFRALRCVGLDYVPQDLRALRALLSTMFRRVSCPACVGLDYVPQGLRALRALVSTMFRRVSPARVPLCSAGSPCPACVQVRTGTKVSEAIHPNSVLMRKS